MCRLYHVHIEHVCRSSHVHIEHVYRSYHVHIEHVCRSYHVHIEHVYRSYHVHLEHVCVRPRLYHVYHIRSMYASGYIRSLLPYSVLLISDLREEDSPDKAHEYIEMAIGKSEPIVKVRP